MTNLVISHPTKIVNGKINLPASKSISNRLLLMRAVAGFTDVEIHNLSNARDTVILNNILSNLKTTKGVDAHDAGTVMRFLTAYLSCREGEWILTGSERMQQRPIGILVGVLKTLGADIEYMKNKNYPPLKIKGKKLKGGKIEIDGSVSSQFLSALLMISPLYEDPLELCIKNDLVSVPYVEMTLRLMQQWGGSYTWNENSIRVENNSYKKPVETLFVESDWSAASYFYSILSLAKDGKITLPHLYKNSIQGDSVCAEVFEELGVSTYYNENGIVLKKNNSATKNFEYNFLNCPDLAQTFAVCCAAKGIWANLTGLQTLAIKETDRISAIKTQLEKFGVSVSVTKDKIQSHSNNSLNTQYTLLNTFDDHRMAMSFAPFALCCDKIAIENSSVVEKSFPHFWEELKQIGFTIT